MGTRMSVGKYTGLRNTNRLAMYAVVLVRSGRDRRWKKP